jgi:DNA-binding NtrC family response regulator
MDTDVLYAGLFPEEAGAAFAGLVQEFPDEARLIEDWRELCEPTFGVHAGLTDRTFRELAVPLLRQGTRFAVRGDVRGFIAFGRDLGTFLADSHVPFVAFVTSLTMLRRCYAKIFAHAGNLAAILHLIDNVHSCLVSATADTYYRRSAELPAATGDAPPAPEPPASTEFPETFHDMVGRSPAMRRVFQQITRIAPGSSPVLVLGETGTGKELVARALHRCGPRAKAPFIAVNCAALPRDLIESELFGYQRGAFTGATSEGLGLFRAASGGVVFLDEITEMRPELQAKLLRVLQEGAVRPVGSVGEVRVDVRVIASSNRDPETALAGGILRPDLYYRVSVNTIRLPPLRERRDDIRLLVAYHLRTLHDRAGTQQVRIAPEALRAMEAQPWLGNVRELQNVLESAVTMFPKTTLTADDLGMTGRATVPAGEGGTLAANERALIEQKLIATGGNKRRTAHELGISRTKLYAKLAKYGLDTGRKPGGCAES